MKKKTQRRRENIGAQLEFILKHPGQGMFITRLSDGSVACNAPGGSIFRGDTVAHAVNQAVKSVSAAQ